MIDKYRGRLNFIGCASLMLMTFSTTAETIDMQEDKKKVKEGAKSHIERIIGGKQVEGNPYPFMVKLIPGGKLNGCGGSLVADNLVLTASHCIEPSSETDENEIGQVFIGSTSINDKEKGRFIDVKNIYINPDQFNKGTKYGDIALLELSEKVSGITPIKMVSSDMYSGIAEWTELTVMGWGERDIMGGGDYPDVLHQVNVPFYDQAQCLAEYQAIKGYDYEFAGLTFCAGYPEGKKDSCHGDSGGPIIFRHEEEWYQVGVVSFGEGCAQENAPGVYATIHQYSSVEDLKNSLLLLNLYDNDFDQARAEVKITTPIKKHFTTKSIALKYSVENIKERGFSIKGIAVEDYFESKYLSIEHVTCDNQTISAHQSCFFEVSNVFEYSDNPVIKLSLYTGHENLPIPHKTISYKAPYLLDQELPEFAQELSLPNAIKWYSNNSGEWTISHENDSTMLTSGDIDDNEFSAVMAQFSGERVESVSFDYKVNSAHSFKLHVNNQRIFRNEFKGENTKFSTLKIDSLLSGNNEIVFNYEKLGDDSLGTENVVIKNLLFTFNNNSPSIVLNKEEVSVNASQSFEIDASSSHDADNDELAFHWQQVSGSKVQIEDATAEKMSAIAPNVTADETIHLRLTVKDNFGGVAEKQIQVKVKSKPLTKKTSKGKSSGGSMPILLVIILFGCTLYRITRH